MSNVPPAYPDGTNKYGEPPAAPLQAFALPGAPNQYTWLRDTTCYVLAPGYVPASGAWSDTTQLVRGPPSWCSAPALPAYRKDTGAAHAYSGAKPVAVYSYTVPTRSW